MRMSRWCLSIAALAAWPAMGDVTYFSGRDVVADFENFLGASGSFTHVWLGKTNEGKVCRFTITKYRKQLLIHPTTLKVKEVPYGYKNDFVARQSDFIVGEMNRDVDGGFEGNRLWSSYFIDRKGAGDLEYPHGQFGISFRLEMEKNDSGKLTRISYSKTRIEDLGYYPLGSLVCYLNP